MAVPVQVLSDAVNPRGGAWNTDGVIIFAAGFGEDCNGFHRRGSPTTLTEIDYAHQEISHRWPQFLPDGRHLRFVD